MEDKKDNHVHMKPLTSVKGATMMTSTSTVDNNNETDIRKSNRRSSIRKKHANLQKARMIEKCERAARDITVAEWVHKNNVGREFENCLGKYKT